MSATPRVALIGSEAAGLQTLRLLLQRRCDVVAVVESDEERPRGATLAHTARRAGLPVETRSAIHDDGLVGTLRGADLLLNVHSLDLLPERLIEAPRIGSFNLHPGPLPEYAGLMAPSWAIYNGETTHAVTLHWMERGIDTGPVAWANRFPIEPVDTGLTLSARCVRQGIPLIDRLLETVARGENVPRLRQDRSRRRYYGRESPQGGSISWSAPGRQIADFVRASDYRPFASPWGHPTTRLGPKTIEVVEATWTKIPTHARPGTVAVVEGTTRVAAGDTWVEIVRIAIDGTQLEPEQLLRTGQELT